MKFANLLIIVFSLVVIFPYNVKAEQSDKLTGIDVDKIIKSLPKDFDYEAYRLFLVRANKTLDHFETKNEKDLAFHPVIVDNPFFSNRDNNILLEYRYIVSPHDINLPKQSAKWIIKTIKITWGKDIMIEHKNETFENFILFGRDCHRFVTLVIDQNSIFSYEENVIPDQSHGYSLLLQTNKKQLFDIDFNHGFQRIVELDNKGNIINDKKKPYPAIKKEFPSKTNSEIQKNNYFSLDKIIVSPKLTSAYEEKVKSKIDFINELVSSTKDSKRENLLKHNVFLNDTASQIFLRFQWKEDGTLKVSVEQYFEKNDNILGYSMIFHKNGHLHLYREGNIPSIKNFSTKFKFSGTEILFHENGLPALYRSFVDGKLSNDLMWNKESSP
ncbi:MAG: hypothetical protein LBE12_17420 [Planctomycetaceae bacterium]|jgi:hypothetical protein|nr:hypothetical protein [Planctomycetaceae bacterium]